MGYRPGSTLIVEFPISGSSGLVNFDGSPTPAATLVHNGTDDGAVTVTLVAVSTGRYKATCTIPSGYAGGDSIALWVTGSIGGVAAGQAFANQAIDFPTVTLSSGDETNLALLPTINTNVSAIPAAPSANTIAAAVAGIIVDGTFTLAQTLAVLGAGLAGISFGQSTTSPGFKNLSNSKTVIAATTDGSGNRTAVTLTP